ncbi:MAG: DUF5675 family protein [Bacteroidota bacterium]
MLEFIASKSESWGAGLLTIRLKRKVQSQVDPPANPAKGLHAYTEQDQAIFFGREQEVEELADRLQNQALTVLTGPSGVGKTSLIQAGLIPRFRQKGWNDLIIIRPGTYPNYELEERMNDLSPAQGDEGRSLLVIDAYEKLLTHPADPIRKSEFIQQLVDWMDALPQLRILISIRSDFEEQVPKGSLAPRWEASRYELPSLTQQQMYTIISQMALHTDLEMEEEFAARVIEEAAGLDAPLPHLSFALSGLFERKLAEEQHRSLRLSDYIDMGQVGIALYLQLEDIYAELGAGGENLIRLLFEMVSFETDIPASRWVHSDELGSRSVQEMNVSVSQLRATLAPIAERLLQAGLLVSGLNHDQVKYYEPAHDILLTAWPRLVEWIEGKRPASSPPPPPLEFESKIPQNIWDDIAYSVNNESCILILGPGVMVDHKGYPLQTRLRQAFANQISASSLVTSGSLLDLGDRLDQPSKRSRAAREVYQQKQVHEIYSLLAYIPFSLILSTSPDTLLHQAFEQQGIDHQFAYYNYKQGAELLDPPSKSNPLIYNIFGNWEEADSLILCNEDLFAFLFRILGNNPFPSPLKEKFATAHSFVFLGFDFYSREYDLLLRLLEAHRKDVNFTFVNQIQLENHRRSFLEKQFHIDFIEHNPFEFILEFYQRCSKIAILREVQQNTGTSVQQKVRKKIKNDKLDDAIEVLKVYFQEKEEKELYVELVKFSADYRRQVNWLDDGTISRAKFDLKLNKITRGLLEIAQELDSSIGVEKGSFQAYGKPNPEQISTLIRPVSKQSQSQETTAEISQFPSMSESDWDGILTSIERESTVLFLGPGAIMGRNGENLHDKLCSLMEDSLEQKAGNHPDRLFTLGDEMTRNRGRRTQLSDVAREVYFQESPHEVYESLAQIPLPLIISCSPDMLIPEVFRQMEIRYQFEYYHDRHRSEVNVSVSKDNPLVYNLFGTIENEDSLVLTHDRLYDFLFSILGNKPIPPRLRKSMLDADHFVFLGFDFESWYMKLLLQLFQTHQKDSSYAVPWNASSLRASTLEYYASQFQLNILSENVVEFVQELYTRCDKEGMLRTTETDSSPRKPAQEVLLEIKRTSSGTIDTLGELYLNGEFVCYTLENPIAPDGQVPTESLAIPAGTYPISLSNQGGKHATYQYKFGDLHKGLLAIEDVPGFDLLHIHIGNEVRYTYGSIIVGTSFERAEPDSRRKVLYSEKAYLELYQQIVDLLESGATVKLKIG